MDSQLSLFGYPFSVTVSGYGMAVVISSIIVYWLYISRIYTREVPPPLSVWGLWLLLDVVATGAELANGVFNVQLVTYTIGTSIVCFVLLSRLNTKWDMWWDTVTTLLVIASVVGWLYANDPLIGLIFSLTGMSVAAVPLFRAVLNGADEPVDAWLVITIGSALNYLDGKVLSSVWLGILQFAILLLILWCAGRRRVAVVQN